MPRLHCHVLSPWVIVAPPGGRPHSSEGVPEGHCTAKVVALESTLTTEPTKGDSSPRTRILTVVVSAATAELARAARRGSTARTMMNERRRRDVLLAKQTWRGRAKSKEERERESESTSYLTAMQTPYRGEDGQPDTISMLKQAKLARLHSKHKRGTWSIISRHWAL